MWPSFFGQIMHLHTLCAQLQSRLVKATCVCVCEKHTQREKFCLCWANTSLVSSAYNGP